MTSKRWAISRIHSARARSIGATRGTSAAFSSRTCSQSGGSSGRRRMPVDIGPALRTLVPERRRGGVVGPTGPPTEGIRMLLLDLALTDHEHDRRAAFVLRSELPGAPLLTLNEEVVIRDEGGHFFAGSVIDSHDAGHDIGYLVRVGVRMPQAYALLRLGLPDVDADGTVRPVRTVIPAVPRQRNAR